MKNIIFLFTIALPFNLFSQDNTIYVGYTKYEIAQLQILKIIQEEVQEGYDFCDFIKKYSEAFDDSCHISIIDFTVYFETTPKSLEIFKKRLAFNQFYLIENEKTFHLVVLKDILGERKILHILRYREFSSPPTNDECFIEEVLINSKN